jgi:hypothetical protein
MPRKQAQKMICVGCHKPLLCDPDDNPICWDCASTVLETTDAAMPLDVMREAIRLGEAKRAQGSEVQPNE